jgi:Fur family ferric uptake transcriptional regulator
MQKDLTKHRATILNVLTTSEIPLNARGVHRKAKGINIATVYRALQYLEENRYVAGFTIVCAHEGIIRYYYKQAQPHTHFLHCEQCHSFFPYMDCTISASVRKIEKQYNFFVHSHVLYFVGVCGDCNSIKNKN